MKIIRASNGMPIMVDDEDFDRLSSTAWCITGPHSVTNYASANARLPDGRHTTVKMHRIIMGAKSGQTIDHIDGNTLNNQKCNLRFVTTPGNGRAFCAKPRTRRCTSKYRGVSWHPQTGKWRARVTIDHKQVCAGLHETEEMAAIAYNKKATELWFFKEALNKMEAA